jgi:hypothetical protein
LEEKRAPNERLIVPQAALFLKVQLGHNPFCLQLITAVRGLLRDGCSGPPSGLVLNRLRIVHLREHSVQFRP